MKQNNNVYDLVIVGSGPAGMTAAIFAARHGLNFKLITKDIGGMANLAPQVETYPGCPHLSGYSLMKEFQKQLEEYKVKIEEGEEVQQIIKKKNYFSIKTNRALYETLSVIIATGRRDKELGIKGEKKYFGKGLSYCAICDSPVFKGKTVAVIGGGRSGLLSTMFMLKMMPKIYIIEKESELGGPELTAEIAKYINIVKNAKNVEILTDTKVLEIIGNKFVKGIIVSQEGKKKEIPIDAVFIEIGYEPNSDFVKGFVKLNRRKEIIVDKNSQTSIAGIYAAGDVTDIIGKQIIIACGEGANALVQVSAYIEKAKLPQSVR